MRNLHTNNHKTCHQPSAIRHHPLWRVATTLDFLPRTAISRGRYEVTRASARARPKGVSSHLLIYRMTHRHSRACALTFLHPCFFLVFWLSGYRLFRPLHCLSLSAKWSCNQLRNRLTCLNCSPRFRRCGVKTLVLPIAAAD